MARNETITRSATAEFRHMKVIGRGGEFAIVSICLEPLPRGAGIIFENVSEDYAVPKHLIGAVEEGIREAATSGIVNGGAVVDFKAILLDGKYHEIDSNWRVFNLAAQGAFRDAMGKAGPIML